MDDLLIRGGQLIDGSGSPGRDADVAVREGPITAVEPRSALLAQPTTWPPFHPPP